MSKKTFITIACSMLLAFSCLCAPVFAGEGDGDGTGDGKNKSIALTLESASVMDGQTGVGLNEIIQLNFNKNVCNVYVISDNRKCFHLTSEAGEAVPITLTFPDDQLQRDYKRQVFLAPRDNLQPDTRYRISVDSTLQAKNGTYIDNAHVITFTTGDSEVAAGNAVLDELGDNIVVYETAFSETADSVPVNTEGLQETGGGTDMGSLSKVIAIVLILIIAASIVIAIAIRKRKAIRKS